MTTMTTSRAGDRPISERLCLALDLDDLKRARQLARHLKEHFRVAKVGLELFSSAGPAAVSALVEDGYLVFLDLKLHDIPTTVSRAARVLGGIGASMLTVHTAGGATMVRQAVEGLLEGAARAGLEAPIALGVTVLTSEAEAPSELLGSRARLALEAGCGGVVCGASDLSVVSSAAPGLLRVVPGTRPAGAAHDDQARVATPEQALLNGADLLVIGRAVTAAADPEQAARDLVEGLSAAR